MTVHNLTFSIIVLAFAVFASQAAQPEPRKLDIKPPLPDTAPEELPSPIKVVEASVPRVEDTNRPYDVILVAPKVEKVPVPGEVAIGFFNHSDRDLILEVNDRTVKLGTRHYLQLKLPREFNWREKNGTNRTTKVPADADGAEIVFKK